MIIIIVGPDGSGKSTLFNSLKKELQGFSFFKGTLPQGEEEIKERKIEFEKMIKEKKNVVYDRNSLIDDLVYEPIFKKEKSLLENKILEVKENLKKAHVIYLDSPIGVLRERIKKRGDDYVNEEMIEEIKKNYNSVFQKLNINPLRVNTSSLNEKEVLNYVLKYIKSNLNKIAYIFPLNYLEKTKDNYYHMCLANLVLENKEYASFYKRMVEEGKYVIMDNGAAEGKQLNLQDMLLAYKKIKPSEIVLLDSMGSAKETIYKTFYSLKFFKEEKVESNFMAVTHGEDMQELVWCAVELLKMGVKTIGVPKMITKTFKDEMARFRAVAFLNKIVLSEGKKIHLLGCNENLETLKEIFDGFESVRSCDTAFPFIYSKTGKELGFNSSRPEGHINFIKDEVEQNVLEKNIKKIEGYLK